MTDYDPVEPADPHHGSSEASELPDEADDLDDPGWPWSFVLLVVAGAIYLIFRFIQLGIAIFT